MHTHNSFVRFVSCTLVASVVTFGPLYSPVVHAETSTATSPTVVIGEVAWAGSSLSTADEWIELWNVGDEDLSVADWSLVGAGENGRTIVLPSDAMIPAKSAYLIANYSASDTKSALTVSVNVVTTTVSLSNSVLGITLVDETGAVVDNAGDGTVPFAGASLPIKTSMMRQDVSLDGSFAHAWTPATTSQNLKPDISDLATPGVCDGCAVEEIVIETPMADAPANEPSTSSTSSTESLPPETVTSTDALISASSTDAQIAETQTNGTSTELLVETIATTTSSTVESMTTEEPLVEPTPSLTVTTTTNDVHIVETFDMGSATSTTTSTAPTEMTSSTMETPPPATAEIISQPLAPAYGLLRLNEIMAHPALGKEWVEVVSLDASSRIPLEGCELHDAVGKIATFGTLVLDSTTSTHVVIELSTSRLNNGGDTVSLYDPDGHILDTVSYGETEAGSSLIRFPESSGAWQKTLSPTPGMQNILTLPEGIEEEENETTTQDTEAASSNEPVVSPTTTAATSAPPISKTVGASKKPTPVPAPVARSGIHAAAATSNTKTQTTKKSATTVQTTKPTTSKNARPTSMTSSKKLTSARLISMDMLSSESLAGIRVRLRGTVGSPSGLLTGHTFILHSPDGRGLRVSVPTSRKLPVYLNEIDITGTLQFDAKNIPTLKLGAKDLWSTQGTSTKILEPRIVDLMLPGAEDAWSLIRLTGTVKSIKGQTIHLYLEDAEIDVLVRPVIKYRVKRLAVGDIITVTGVFDSSSDVLRLLPRSMDDISLITHAQQTLESASAKKSGSTLPPWSPLGAAAGAIAVTEGAKHVHRIRRHKILERRLETISRTKEPSIPEGTERTLLTM